MVKMKLFLFRIILYLFTATSFLLNNGCFNYSPKTHIDSNQTGFNSKYLFYVNTGTMNLVEKKSVNFTNPIKFYKNSIFISDFRGNKDPEIAISGGKKLTIYNINGDLLLEKVFKKSYQPSFVFDIDKDGKSDIILRTSTSPRNEIVIINGAGNIISNFLEDKSSQNFSSIIPIGILQNRLFATARSAFPEGERGILCFNPFSMNLLYTFYTPDPIGISILESDTPNPVIIPSYKTHNDGIFRKYAKESDNRTDEDYEKVGAFLKIDLNGTPLKEYEILNRNNIILGTLEYKTIPGSEKEIVLLHYLSDSNNNFYHILKIDTQTGAVISQGVKQRGNYLDSVIVPLKKDFRLLTTIKKDNRYYLIQFSSSQKQIGIISVNSRPILKQVVINNEKDEYLVLIILSDGIYTLNENIELTRIIEGENFLDIKLYKYKNKKYAILLQKRGFNIYIF